ncbi:MAG: threonylcarbamoyl-AMP synthase [Erysipelotrichaceae bacterium]|nr:threonylcarbamoyl-AMP synthase [Erysipelotrichaceae bacterium]
MTRVLFKKDLEETVELLKSGAVVAFPTDTVFGIGVIYNDAAAIDRMKKAKGRDASKPFPLMVADLKQLEEVAYVTDRERRIAQKYTPGALTLVLKRKDTVARESVNGFDTIAIRIPDDRFVLKLLKKAGPMFVTSANISGEPAACNEKEVLQQLDGRIEAVVRGKAGTGVASTIIDCTGEELKCLREGTISYKEIEEYAG